MDFEDDYKTMDLDFMESVWWVFRQLWDKDLVYRDFKVLPYSYGAATPLSNFEVNLGAYRTNLADDELKRLDRLASQVKGDRYDERGMTIING